jgi:hypothetical protein
VNQLNGTSIVLPVSATRNDFHSEFIDAFIDPSKSVEMPALAVPETKNTTSTITHA